MSSTIPGGSASSSAPQRPAPGPDPGGRGLPPSAPQPARPIPPNPGYLQVPQQPGPRAAPAGRYQPSATRQPGTVVPGGYAPQLPAGVVPPNPGYLQATVPGAVSPGGGCAPTGTVRPARGMDTPGIGYPQAAPRPQGNVAVPAVQVRGNSWWHRIRRVLSSLLVVIVGVIAACAVVVSVASRLSPNGKYEIFGHPVMIVLSGSMTPTIRTGDLVVDDPVTRAEASHLHVGQVISFVVDHTKVFTHRIVAVVRGPDGTVSYRTKGDANDAPDAALRPASSVIGLFSFRIPDGGYALYGLQKPLAFVFLILAIALAVIAGSLFRMARDVNGREESAPMAT